MLEKEIQKVILQWLRLQKDAFVWRQNSGAVTRTYNGKTRFYRNQDVEGIADIIGIWKGRPLAIEVKRPGGIPSDTQRAFLQEFENHGGIAIVATSLESVEKVLKKVDA